MAYFQRLIITLILSIPAFLPNTSFADYPSTPIWKTDTGTIFYGATAAEALDKYVARFSTCTTNTQYINTVIEKLATTYRVNWLLCSNNSQLSTGYIDASKLDDCGNGVYESPYNGVCTGSPPTPTCTPPLVLDAGSNTCKDPCEPKKWKDASYFTQGQSWPYTCFESCQVEGSSGDCGFNAAGVEGCYYQGRFTGVSCTGTEAGTGQTPPVLGDTPEYDCIKDGKTWGTVNGATVCVNKGTSGSSPTTSTTAGQKTTTKNADGTTTVTQEPSKVVSMGSGSGGGTKVTEETKNADGTTTTKESDASTYCQNNPTADVCKQMDKGSFNGSCEQGFVCNGDAASCAIAREVHTRNCELFKTDSEFATTFTSGKSSETTSSNLIPRTTVNIVQSLDSSSSIAASCPPDKTIQVMTQTVTFPISQLCGTLEALGYIFLALAYVAAARIIGGAV